MPKPLNKYIMFQKIKLGSNHLNKEQSNKIKWGLPKFFYTNFKRNKYFFDILQPGTKGYIGEFLQPGA
jgi:hypothetical protein